MEWMEIKLDGDWGDGMGTDGISVIWFMSLCRPLGQQTWLSCSHKQQTRHVITT